MGKNSLLKPTSKKKKITSRKKDAEVTAKIEKPAATAKKAQKKVTVAPKAEKPTDVRAQKAAAPKLKKVSVKELLQKRFDLWKPDKLFTVEPDKEYLKTFVAPPFFKDMAEEKARRIKELLFKKFDMAAIRAAAQKAAAQKAAAEKAAVKKAAEPDMSVTYKPPADVDTSADDPMKKAMKYGVAVFVVLVALIIITSFLNKNNYYIKSSQGAVEIWQGKFSPMGEELLIVLAGSQLPETKKAVYKKTDVYPLIFNYYVEKADTLSEVPGMPDFEGIQSYLNKALAYASSADFSKIAHARLNNLNLMILIYKSDVAADKGTVADLENAKGYLAQAARLDIDARQRVLLEQKRKVIDNAIAGLQAKEAEAAAAPAPK